jgi:beta-lactamase regulating signal transducer with metallopeptidase domain
MIGALARAELFVLTLVTFALLSMAASSLLVPWALVTIRAWPAARRHTALLLLSFAPLLLTALLSTAALMPSLLSLIDAGWDHCLAHDDGHPHLCFLHMPKHAPHAFVWVLTGSIATWLAVHALLRMVDVVRAAARVRLLVRTGERRDDAGVTILDALAPFCAAVGLFAPRVLVSRSLLESLSEAQRAALLAHESSHARRRDALARLAAWAATVMYPHVLRRRLDHALELAAEQACDDDAASVVGDRVVVAETILEVERAFTGIDRSDASLVAMGMHQSQVVCRVEALLAEPLSGDGLRALYACLVVATVALGLSSEVLHHAVESWLSPLLR